MHIYNLHSNIGTDNELKDTMEYSNVCIAYFDFFGSRITDEEIRKQ